MRALFAGFDRVRKPTRADGRALAAFRDRGRSLKDMKTTIIGAMLLALVACASSGENTRTKVGA